MEARSVVERGPASTRNEVQIWWNSIMEDVGRKNVESVCVCRCSDIEVRERKGDTMKGVWMCSTSLGSGMDANGDILNIARIHVMAGISP